MSNGGNEAKGSGGAAEAGASFEGLAHPVDSPTIWQDQATVRPGLTAPIFRAVDPDYPLHPSNLETRSMAVQEVIDAANSLRRRSKRLGLEPSWPPILRKLQVLEKDYSRFIVQARDWYEKNLHYLNLIQGLPMDNLDNIKALMEIKSSLEDSRKTWESVYSTYVSIVSCIDPDSLIPPSTRS